LLLIGVQGPMELLRVVFACTIATLVFAAVTLGWFRLKSRWWENVLLTFAVVLLFRPDFFMDRVAAEFREVPASQVFEVARSVAEGESLVMVIKGTTLEGDDVSKTVAVQLGPVNADGRRRLADAGMQLVPLGTQVQIGAVRFGSQARKAGVEQGWEVQAVKVPTGRASPHWFYLPGLLLIGVVWLTQGRRSRTQVTPGPTKHA
jgi:hypothetical protein